jgi:hypothetical protein
MVEIVLLNVLIAVASDSYEKCLMRAQHLFGRARVMLIAELVSFQNLLRQAHVTGQQTAFENSSATVDTRETNEHQRSRCCFRCWLPANGPCQNLLCHPTEWYHGSVIFVRASTMVVVGWTLGEIIGFFVSERRHGNILMSLASILVNILVFAGMMVFLQNRLDGLPHAATSKSFNKNDGQADVVLPMLTSSSPTAIPSLWRLRLDQSEALIGKFTSWYDRVAQKAVLRMFGSMQESSSTGVQWQSHWGSSVRFPASSSTSWTSAVPSPLSPQEWNGRMWYLQQQMHHMIQESQQVTMEQLQATERRLLRQLKLQQQQQWNEQHHHQP